MTNTNLRLVASTLKLVLSFDEAGSYTPAGHNLAPAQVKQHVQELQSKGHEVVIIDQTERHRALTLEDCRPCWGVAQECTRDHDESWHENQNNE